MNDLYQSVTDRIITALESGKLPPWVKPWASVGGMPRNAVSGRHYSGTNALLLWLNDYADPRYLTYKQAQAVGANVRKGEHGSPIVFFKPLTVTDKKTDELKTIPMLRGFTVFNVSQIEKLPDEFTAPIPVSTHTAHALADSVLSQAVIEHGHGKACYIPSRDMIHLPEAVTFKTPETYYATALHELTHWSGHESRLCRKLSTRFGDASYAAEELIAELGSAFLCAELGIDGQLQHECYLDAWLKIMKADKRAIFTASRHAREAHEFLTGKRQVEEVKEAA